MTRPSTGLPVTCQQMSISYAIRHRCKISIERGAKQRYANARAAYCGKGSKEVRVSSSCAVPPLERPRIAAKRRSGFGDVIKPLLCCLLSRCSPFPNVIRSPSDGARRSRAVSVCVFGSAACFVLRASNLVLLNVFQSCAICPPRVDFLGGSVESALCSCL